MLKQNLTGRTEQSALLYILIDGVFSVASVCDQDTVGSSRFKKPSIRIQKPYIAPLQGEFQYSGGRWCYVDAGNTNTLVNGRSLAKGHGVWLEESDILAYVNTSVQSDADTVLFIFSTDVHTRSLPWRTVSPQSREVKALAGTEPLMFGKPFIRNGHLCFCTTQYLFIREAAYNQMSEAGGKTMRPILENTADKLRAINHTGPEGSGACGVKPSDGVLSIHIRERRARSRTLLKDIHVRINDGEMVLLLGGSGAGKTTLLNAVAGLEKADAEIVYNGIDLYKNERERRALLRVVPQFNVQRESDSVYKTLEDIYNIYYGPNANDCEMAVENALEVFGLSKESSNLVSKLSGGQKKRLSIAAEYITNPRIFLLDEPDSGLDAGSSIAVMDNLRNIVNEGKICLVISHSPNRIAHCFDRIIVLAKDTASNTGRLAFTGTLPEAYRFFGTEDIEGIVKRINPVSEGGSGKADEYIQKFRQIKGWK